MPRKGYQRKIHQYIQRFWNVARQDWDYLYPQEVTAPNGTNSYGLDPDANAMAARGKDRWRSHKEEQLADELDALKPGKPGSGRNAPEDEDDSKDEKFLEGFEEGYKLAKEVDKETVKKSLTVLRTR